LADSIISASGLTKRFGPSAGVFDLDLEIAPGLIVGLIGPSGSGKTTTVRLMTGILSADSGQLSVLGADPESFTSATRQQIGYMPQDSNLDPHLTLHENLNFAASLYGMSYQRSRQLDRIIDFVELQNVVHRLPGEASGGERRRLMLASTLIHQPELIFLDEPTAGIDPVLRKRIWDRLRELGEQGRSLMVTTQYVGEAAYCDYVVVLAHGRRLIADTPEGLRSAAYGGELIDITFEQSLPASDVASLEETITTQPMRWIDSRSVRLVVDDAGAAAPEVAKWAEQRGVSLEKVEAFLPPYDDVFVHLVDRFDHDEDRGAELLG
jgi:ABC-2 type transport system ATP-binding protein